MLIHADALTIAVIFLAGLACGCVACVIAINLWQDFRRYRGVTIPFRRNSEP